MGQHLGQQKSRRLPKIYFLWRQNYWRERREIDPTPLERIIVLVAAREERFGRLSGLRKDEEIDLFRPCATTPLGGPTRISPTQL